MKILHIVPGLNDPTNGIAVAAKMIARRQGGEFFDCSEISTDRRSLCEAKSLERCKTAAFFFCSFQLLETDIQLI